MQERNDRKEGAQRNTERNFQTFQLFVIHRCLCNFDGTDRVGIVASHEKIETITDCQVGFCPPFLSFLFFLYYMYILSFRKLFQSFQNGFKNQHYRLPLFR